MPRLNELREEAAGFRACPLWKTGTQTVFGEGRAGAVAMFVGEQPGDQEDKTGHRPFVGPAGSSTRRSRRPRSIARPCTSRTP